MPQKTGFIAVVLLLIAVLMFSGCSSIFPPPTKKTTMPNGTVIEEPMPQAAGTGLFESKNLSNFYDMETKRVDKHAELVDKKIDAIRENAAKMLDAASTPGEKLLASVVTSQQLAAIPTAPMPDGIKAPKTITDVFDSDLLDWTKLYIDWRKSKKKDNDSGGNNITGNGNIINYMSPDSFNPTYSLGEGAVGTWHGNNYTLSDESTHDSHPAISLF